MIHLKLLGRTKRKRMRENKGCLWDLWTTRIWGEIWASQKSPNRFNPKRSSLRLSSHWQRCAVWTQQEKRDPSHSRDHPQSISRLLSTNLTGQERVRWDSQSDGKKICQWRRLNWAKLSLRNEGEEFPSWQTWLVSMRTWVWSLALLSGWRIWHCGELWCRSQTWLRFHVAVAVV